MKRDAKKAVISIETIVIIILALLVLVIVAAAFSGGMSELWRKITGYYKIYAVEDESAARARCDNFCAFGDYTSFCKITFQIGNETKSCTAVGASWPAAKC
jgi:hypothetical protein